jgi:hypothetical protein
MPDSPTQRPLLLIRATAGDTAARPITGVFWESPDIFVVAGVSPNDAPAVPVGLSGVAQANADNTVYARVWNFGAAPAVGALVEFYWFPPTLRFDTGAESLIGSTVVTLGPIGAHQIVKCPNAWRAQFLNGGHECLVVRVSQPATDPLGSPEWDASRNRHVGQRNIHVMNAAEAATRPRIGIIVGALGGRAAQVSVSRAAVATMLLPDILGAALDEPQRNAASEDDVGLTPPAPAGEYLPDRERISALRAQGLIACNQVVTHDGQLIAFSAREEMAGSGEAVIYRVIGSQDGKPIGGYTVVIVGPHPDPRHHYAAAD